MPKRMIKHFVLDVHKKNNLQLKIALAILASNDENIFSRTGPVYSRTNYDIFWASDWSRWPS